MRNILKNLWGWLGMGQMIVAEVEAPVKRKKTVAKVKVRAVPAKKKAPSRARKTSKSA